MAWILAALPLIVRGGTVRRLDRLRRRCFLGSNPAASLVPADVGRAQRIGRAGGWHAARVTGLLRRLDYRLSGDARWGRFKRPAACVDDRGR